MKCLSRLLLVATLAMISGTHGAFGIVPEFTVDDDGVHIAGVGPGNPIIYDNDWWFDVFDNNYLWVQASLGKAKLVGNIVSRDMWDWEKGYLYPMQKCVDDAKKAIAVARKSGVDKIPDVTLGADEVLARPESGSIEDTVPKPSDGSRLIVAQALAASPEKPLLVICGGPLTTVANALLTDPGIAPNIVVFSLTVGNYGYNGKDGWSAYIVAKRAPLVDWATGTFWDRESVLRPEHFKQLPENPFCDEMRKFIRTDLGKANQLGDGAPLVWLFDNRCWKDARFREAVWQGKHPNFRIASDGDVLDIPKEATDLDRCRREFFQAVENPAAYR